MIETIRQQTQTGDQRRLDRPAVRRVRPAPPHGARQAAEMRCETLGRMPMPFPLRRDTGVLVTPSNGIALVRGYVDPEPLVILRHEKHPGSWIGIQLPGCCSLRGKFVSARARRVSYLPT